MALSLYSFVDVPALKEYVGAGGDGQDGNYERALNAALRVVEGRQGREWVTRGSKTEYHSLRGGHRRIRMSQWPVKTVTSVHESTSWPRVWDSTTLLVEGTDYLVDNETGELRRIGGGGGLAYWACGERAVRVIRVAGYTQPFAASDTSGAYTRAEALDALAELTGLVLVIAAGIFKEGDTRGWGDTDTTDAQGAVRRALAYLSPSQLEALDSYRRIEFGERTWEIAA